LEQSRIAKQEMWQLYKTRKENLEKLLAKKREELKEVCVKEAEITGRLPKEYPLEKGEEPPVVKRKIGASYQFNQISNHLKDGQSSLNINELTIELEIQNKITNAALILASDPSANKAIRKQRREFYEKAREKLNKIEAKLNELKLERFNKLSQSINMSK
jgi:FERM domain-containing protein 4